MRKDPSALLTFRVISALTNSQPSRGMNQLFCNVFTAAIRMLFEEEVPLVHNRDMSGTLA